MLAYACSLTSLDDLSDTTSCVIVENADGGCCEGSVGGSGGHSGGGVGCCIGETKILSWSSSSFFPFFGFPPSSFRERLVRFEDDG